MWRSPKGEIQEPWNGTAAVEAHLRLLCPNTYARIHDAAAAKEALAQPEPRQANTDDLPELRTRVNDYSKVLSDAEAQQLREKLARFEASIPGHPQAAMLIIPSTRGVDIELYSQRLFRKWKLGSKEENNGVIFVVATDDHTARIHLGTGIETFVSDEDASAVMRKYMIPSLASGDVFSALNLGCEAVELHPFSTGQGGIADKA